MWLYLAELVYNTAKNMLTGEFPCNLLYAQPHDVLKCIPQPNTVMNPQRESVEEWLEKIQNCIRDAQKSIRHTALIQKKYYDNRHSPLPTYKEGDYACLRLDLHPTSVRHNKLSMQKLPPYCVKRVLSNGHAVELEFPEQLRGVYPVISVQQIEKTKNLAENPWQWDHPRPSAVDEAEEFFTAEIIDERTSKRGWKSYKVRWVGYPLDKAQWVKVADVSQAAIDEWNERLRRQRLKGTTNLLHTNMELDRWRAAMSTSCLAGHAGQASGHGIRDDPPFEYKVTIPKEGRMRERPVLYISRTTKPFEQNYESIERELGCVV